VESINGYAGFVDIDSLRFLWPQEFNPFKICIFVNTAEQKRFEVFSNDGVRQHLQDELIPVLIHFDGYHFTVLNPSFGYYDLDAFLDIAKAQGYLVLNRDINVTTTQQFSVINVADELRQNATNI